MPASRSSLLLLLALSTAGLSGCHARKAGPDDLASSGAEPSSPLRATRNTHTVPSQVDLVTLRTNFQKVHFDFDKATLTPAAREALEANATILMKYSQVHVRVEGHTDSYGSDEYNLALGDRRARSVHRYLLDMGVSESKLTLVSFGKEQTVVGHGSIEAEAPNRRAEFVVLSGTDVAESSNAQPGVDVTVSVGG